ncbi:MAG: ferredoxin domain-containing protein [Candidatus Bathyarchaeota archaeon]
MPIESGEDFEKRIVVEASKLMAISARTAPKSGGVDDILISLVTGEEKNSIAKLMEKTGEEKKSATWGRDAKNVQDSDTILLVGVRGKNAYGANCGGCGYPSCEEFKKVVERTSEADVEGPNCMFKVLDLGIAVGSAVKTASIHNLDNRVMYRIGVAAKKLKLLPEATIILGIPVSAKGKNIYFDRKI